MKKQRLFARVFLYSTLLIFFGVFFCAALFGQNTNKKTAKNNLQQEAGSAALPTSYRNYNFGDSIDAVQSALSNDSLFLYEGEPDVTMIEPPDRTTLGITGRGMLLNGFFVFYQEKLYEIILEINPEYLDHFALYTQLYKKYGEPTELNPQRVLWEDDNVMVNLERSLFVKYIDKKVFDEVKEKMNLHNSYEIESREEFLDGL